MKILIRLAEPADAFSIINFNQQMALETEGKELSLEVITAGVNAVFGDQQKGFYVVAETEVKEIIGCLMITFEWSDWRERWFWWIQSVYVRNGARGQGVYRKLYEWVKNKADASGNVCGIRLYVEKENRNAQQVYEKLGMEETHYLMYEAAFEKEMTFISEIEFAKICRQISVDRQQIYEFNRNVSREEVLLLDVVNVFDQLSQSPRVRDAVFSGAPDAETYRQAILQVLKRRTKPAFEPERYLDELTDVE